jgi:hypothetical protein
VEPKTPRILYLIWDFYRKDTKFKLLGYADAEYLSDPHKADKISGYPSPFNNVWFNLMLKWLVLIDNKEISIAVVI